MAMSAYLQNEPTLVDHDSQPYVGIRDKVTMATLGALIDRLPEVFQWIGARGLAPAGPPFFRYHVIDMERELDITVGVPLAAAVAGDERVGAGELPAGRYLTTAYTGHPDDLIWVTRDFLFWANDHGISFDRWGTPEGDAWASRLEFYETDPAVEPDMKRWVTVLSFKVAD
jgi:effector-binding domain-containing protein